MAADPRQQGTDAVTHSTRWWLLPLTLLLVLGLTTTGPAGRAVADPGPAVDDADAVALAGGHLSRLVTATGAVVGGDSASERAWTLMGLGVAQVGRQAADRIAVRIVQDLDAVAEDGVSPDEASTPSLALQTLALALTGVDVTTVGTSGTDLVATIRDRQQPAGPDAGLYGQVDTDQAVPGHALAILALHAAGEPADAAALTWLEGQRCPNGGWPAYRDPASRSTTTCEILPADTASTSLAAQAQQVAGATDRHEETQRYLRAAGDGTGAFARAPGLVASPRATAQAIAAIRATTGAAPDRSWDGTAGGPQEVLRAEMLGCGWHGTDRGAFPTSMRDTAGEPTPEDPGPGQTDLPSTTAQALLALAGRTLGDLATTAATGGTAYPPAAAVGDPFPGCPVLTDRTAGADRITTAVALSTAAFPDGAADVVVATAGGYADALAGAALAGGLAAPLLLSDATSAPAALLQEIGRLGAQRVVLLGGPVALSAQVEAQIAAVDSVGTVRRIAGAGRAETAALVAAEVGGQRAFLARGFGEDASAPWADALAVGAWSATAGIPVLLTDRDALPPATAEALADRAQVIVLGGTAAVSAQVETAVSDLVDDVTRLAGATRFETSAIAHLMGTADGVDPASTWLATGLSYPDALAAGPAVAASGGALLLVHPDQAAGGVPALSAIRRVDYLVDELHTIGGRAVLPDGVMASLALAARDEADG